MFLFLLQRVRIDLMLEVTNNMWIIYLDLANNVIVIHMDVIKRRNKIVKNTLLLISIDKEQMCSGMFFSANIVLFILSLKAALDDSWN